MREIYIYITLNESYYFNKSILMHANREQEGTAKYQSICIS